MSSTQNEDQNLKRKNGKHIKYLQLAEFFQQWSKDPRTKVGAVIIGDNGQVVQQGYNGFPRGVLDLDERLNDRALKNKYVVHAEANALYNALSSGASVKGTTMYVWGLDVCHDCQKGIIQSGIKMVYMFQPKDKEGWEESTNLAKEMFIESGVEFEVLYEI